VLNHGYAIGLEFNASGAFVGKLTKNVGPPPSADGEIDDQSLIYNAFLATPLLPFGKPGYVEDKWSGTNQTGNNQTSIGHILAAFAHHSVVDSNKTCLLVDLQGLVSPEGAITLIDPQAHTCVLFVINIFSH
jgi:myosin-heavy-chain kinase